MANPEHQAGKRRACARLDLDRSLSSFEAQNDEVYLPVTVPKTFCLLLVMLLCAIEIRAQPTPLIQAHAHNDYEHQRPLLDALDHGFCSVEADIYLVDDRLLVAHEREKVKPDSTLESLYLELREERVKQNGVSVYRGGP